METCILKMTVVNTDIIRHIVDRVWLRNHTLIVHEIQILLVVMVLHDNLSSYSVKNDHGLV